MIIPLGARGPIIPATAYIAKNASVIGDVIVGEHSSIWFGAVVRGDHCSIIIGENTSIQDNAVIHADPGTRTVVGDNVTIGHGAVVHGCTIGDNVLVGMNSTVLNRAEIGECCIIGAGALVTQDKKIPAKSLVLGVPAKVVRELTDEEVESIRNSSREYAGLCREYVKNSL